MRLNLRRGASAPDTEKQDGASGHSGPAATFATMFEGRWLWIYVGTENTSPEK